MRFLPRSDGGPRAHPSSGVLREAAAYAVGGPSELGPRSETRQGGPDTAGLSRPTAPDGRIRVEVGESAATGRPTS